ncbi:MAG: 2-dehydropantoate 2-reductase N-terminal domain-containing protein [Nitrospinota bacterium]|jgi:2-dehydropantoate 2-reductase|nr:2-dehydropantoate 2-reductase N-terminal domain-containing protein [Nitrospinota bacterium]
MDKKIAILGSGAIGSSVGADLTKAEFDVTIFDQWPEHVEMMRAQGLHIEMTDGDLKIPVRAHHLCELASVKMEFDIALIIVKSYDTRWMAELIKPYLKSGGVVVGMQNSMNDDAIASIISRERTIGCVVELSGEIFTPGRVQRDTTRKDTWFSVGELDGSFTPRLEEIRSLLSNVGVTEITNNIYGAKWTKLIANSMAMGPFGSFGLTNWEAMKLPGMFEISVGLGKESMAVGAALEYRMEPIFGLSEKEFAGSSDEVLVTAMKTLMRHVGSKSTTAPIHDHIKGRKSEMEFINGLVSRKGKELGVPTPLNDAVAELARQIDSGELKMDVSNFDLLKARLAQAE